MKLEIKNPEGQVIQTVHLPNGEYTLSISGAQLSHDKTPFKSHRHPGLRAIALTSACGILFTGHQYISTAHLNPEPAEIVKNALEIFLFVSVLTASMSLLSRALTHRFQFWRCLSLVGISFLGYFVLAENLMGLRWALPRLFWVKQVYETFILVWLGASAWWAMDIFLPQLSGAWRKTVVGIFSVFLVVYGGLSFLPIRREYTFFQIQTPPPRPQMFESTPMSVDSFLSLLPNDK